MEKATEINDFQQPLDADCIGGPCQPVNSNRIEWNWVKGHSEDPMNDLADKLAKRAAPV